MSKKEKYLLAAIIIATPIIIYFYFFKWKTTTIYGDDVYFFKLHSQDNTFSGIINSSLAGGKYRPIHALSSQLIYRYFQKNLNDYYLFNVFIQTINTYLIALLINLFLSSQLICLCFSLICGLSRFSFYNICELSNGGALEGLALTFFLLSLFSILRVIVTNNLSQQAQIRGLLLSIIFSNLCMYTHERYIVLFPFIIFAIFLPPLKKIDKNYKLLFAFIAIISIIANVLLKKYVYSIPFLTGTGGTHISFSLSSSFSFFIDGLLSIFQINSGPEYLSGLSFFALPILEKIFVLILLFSTLFVFLSYIIKAKKIFCGQENSQKNNLFIFLLLVFLFLFCLLSAVFTIRLEQRWLQAPNVVFLLLFIIAIQRLSFANLHRRNLFFVLLMAGILWSDSFYFYKGTPKLYMENAEVSATTFKNAIISGLIRPKVSTIYLYNKQMDVNFNSALKWALGDGYFFNFYQGRGKQLIFIDSGTIAQQPIKNLDKNSCQVLYVKDSVIDITACYLKDSLHSLRL